MFVINLSCDNHHHFSGWYDSQKHYFRKVHKNEIQCPLCASHQVTRIESDHRLFSSMHLFPKSCSTTKKQSTSFLRLLRKIQKHKKNTHEKDVEGLPYFHIKPSNTNIQ